MGIRGILNIVRQSPRIRDEILNQVYLKTRANIRLTALKIIRDSLKAHPTYTKISSGEFNKHFGFYPGTGESRISAIATRIVETIDITLIKVKNRINIEAFIDYTTLYAMEEARVINDSENFKRGKSESPLDWLEWMLEAGGRVVVTGFHLDEKDYSNKSYSRSGEAVMGKTGDWSVPSDVAGTISNNWITESLKGGKGITGAEKLMSPEIKQLIASEIKRVSL